MGDLDPGDDIAEPTDAWVAGLIRRVRGLPPGKPVSPALIAAVRSELRRIARRRLVARRERGEPLSATVDDIGDDARESVREVLRELCLSPHGQAGLWFLLALPIVLDAALSGVVRRVRMSARHEAAPARSYLAGKIGGEPWAASWGSRRPGYFGSDGRRVAARSPSELGPHPWHVAAANAVTRARARDWLRWLDAGSDVDRRMVLRDMEEVGQAASAAHLPLPLWREEPGPPRGLWPDPGSGGEDGGGRVPGEVLVPAPGVA